jgi:hypothetical protein
MYALVNGQELRLGPIAFNYRMINDELEELEVDFRVTSQSYQSVPLSITDDIKILPARYDNPEYDPRFEFLSNVTHEITETEVIFRHDKVSKELQQIKDEYKAAVKPERQRKENTTITVTVKDTEITVLTSRESRLELMSKLLGNEGPYNFKFNNGVWLEITKADLEYVISQIDAKVQEAFDWELAKLAEIDACEDGEAVYAVEITPPPAVKRSLI